MTHSLRDTKHLIQVIEGLNVPADSVLVTLDVNSLYTSIPHNDIRTVIYDSLESRRELDPPTQFLMELLDLVLDKNYFRFGDQCYLQVKGVAMGSAAAPSIANMFMESLERRFILNPDANPF